MGRKNLILSLLLTCICTMAMSQYYYTEYGQNRIQYKKFDWYYYATGNFEIYYYRGGQDYAKQALEFLETEFVELTDVLGYAPYTKTKIFIYNSIQDLQQSNIGIGGDVYTIGGKTDFVKLQVEIAYTGQALDFKKEIIHKLTNILINDMMFGGSLAEIFQNAYLLTLPDWFIDGASRYLAYGWSDEMDDYVRDYLERKKITRHIKVQGEDAGIIGQSIWNFIAVKYGEGNVSNILNLTRIIRNEENSIASTLGVSFKQFLRDWQDYYMIQHEEIVANYEAPDHENQSAAYHNQRIRLSHVKVNASGDKMAYTYHKNGRYEVIVKDLNRGRNQTIVKGGYLINDQEIDYNHPLIDWQNDHTVGVILFKRGHLYLNTYDLNTGQKFQKPLNRFKQIESFSFNDNGKLAVISGDIDGQNDLFLISMRRNALKRITNDNYDDIDPTFIPGTAAVVFSSNRKSDSVKVSHKVNLGETDKIFNLFLYDLDTSKSKYSRLTNTFARDSKPVVQNQHTIYYLSDQKGITNLYKYSLLDSTFSQVSRFQHNIQDYDIAFGSNRLSYIMLDDGRDKVFTSTDFDLTSPKFTLQTARKRLEQARLVVSRMAVKRPLPGQENEDESALTIEELPAEVDSLVSPDQYVFEDEVNESAADEAPQANGDFIDTDNYVFEDEIAPVQKPESFFSSYRKFEKKSKVIGPVKYDPKFSFSNVVSSAAIDPFRGFSVLFESEISDIFENHRLTGGVLASRDFRSGDLYAEYDFLKYWMDFRVRLDRKTFLLYSGTGEDDARQKYILNKAEISASIPVSNTVRFELSPFLASTEFRNLNSNYVIGNGGVNVYAPDNKVTYLGGSASMVVDNTINYGFNIKQGTRGLLEYTNYYSPANKDKSFAKIKVDLRHYQKIHKEITLAGRFFFGRSIGNNRQQYVIGGMNNWLFQQFERQGSNDPLAIGNALDNSNLLFTDFVTNLRGFDYNEAFGSNALLFNAELRFPIFRYFARQPLSSNFLKNFQVIGFFDVGSAWEGNIPLGKHQSPLTKMHGPTTSGFSAEIASFQNPWLAGYGWGLRTVLFGYYVKLDVAKPIQDYQIGDRRIYITIGLDF